MMRKTIKVLMAVLCVSLSLGVITACKKTEEPKKTKLDSPVISSKEYTGSNQKATVAENEAYEVTVNEGGINVGEYDVVLTLTDTKKYEWATPDENDKTKVTLKFAITKATNEITSLTLDDWTYGETPKTPTVTAKFGTAECTYATSENGTYSETVPIDAGDYWVKATVAETKNYAGATQTLKFTIARADSTVKTAAAKKELTYNGAAQELVNAATTDDGTIEYKLGKDGAWSANIPTATNAGSYKVYYRIVGDNNHNDFENEILSVNVTISKLKIAKPAADTTVFTYSGNEQTYNVAANERYTVSNDKQTDAGNYKVTVALKDKANVSWADDTTDNLSFDFNIGKKSVEVVWTKADSYVYNDTALTAPTAVMTNVKGEEVALTVSGETLDKAGTFTFTATTEDTNYELTNATCSVTVVLYNEITEFTVTAELNCDETPDINATAKHGEAKYFYAEAEDGEYKEITSETVFAPEKLYYVKAVVAAGENYTGATSEIKTFIKNHEYNENGKCVKGDAYNTAGVTYAYGADKGEYYVTGCADSVTELVILPAYNDGEHGEKAVTYVAHSAFAGKTNIVKVILPESVTDLGGSSFAGCSNLVYVYMPGVKSLIYAVDGRPDGKKDCNNNFLQCYKLTTVIIASDFYTDTQQFTNGNGDIPRIDGAVLEFYVNASAGAPNLEGNNNLWTGNVFYKGDATKCMQWNFDENGNVVHGASEHDFENGKCKVCGKYSDELTQGVVYEYDREEGCYYVGLNRTLNVSELTILGKYNDGIHDEKDVKYVGFQAFMGNPAITKIILPDSVDSLEGSAFMGCSNLEYVSMTGVTTMNWASRYNKKDGDNNFRQCNKLKYVIIGTELTSNCGQFGTPDGELPAELMLNFYVTGVSGVPSLGGTNNLWTGKVYYKGDASKCLQWNYGSDGVTIEHGAAEHKFTDGICEHCGKKDAMGVIYKYNESKQVYYVAGYNGESTTVKVFDTWDDGANGEKAVKYVEFQAFINNTTITKVILPESVDSLEGSAFMGCTNLEYVSMIGVTTMNWASRYNGQDGDNNFRFCNKLKYVIVGTELSSNCGQFNTDNVPEDLTLSFYVKGESGEPNLAGTNNLLRGNTYYFSATEKSGCWHYDEQGNVALWA